MKTARGWAARGLVLTLLLPLWGLALVCQSPATDAHAAMACCRRAHSTCMQGGHQGAMACCQHMVTAPSMLPVTGRETAASSSLAPAVATVLTARPPRVRLAAAPRPPPLRLPPLYQLHASLLI
ncbi:MAG TPA: hypothetical protein VIE13_12060 [Terriglobales bacterium]